VLLLFWNESEQEYSFVFFLPEAGTFARGREALGKQAVDHGKAMTTTRTGVYPWRQRHNSTQFQNTRDCWPVHKIDAREQSALIFNLHRGNRRNRDMTTAIRRSFYGETLWILVAHGDNDDSLDCWCLRRLYWDLLFNFATDIGVTVSCHSDSLVLITKTMKSCESHSVIQPLR
jgi:hypothetical protein